MKDNASNNSTKKKKLLFWLGLAACLLIIAAIIMGVLFARNNNRATYTSVGGEIEGNEPNPGGDEPGGDEPGGNEPGEPDVNTSTQTEFILPIQGEGVSVFKAFEFGKNNTLDRYHLHEAVDFTAPAGTSVVAAVDGVVVDVQKDDQLYYATITLEHANGIVTVYKFVDPVSTLKKNDKVARGQKIGTVAAAYGVENADGDHLHFEVFKDGVITDPGEYIDLTVK